MNTLLEVRNLVTHLDTEDGMITPVDNVSFTIHQSETLGLVGESGCGKSMTALSVMRLVPSPPGRIAGGQVLLQGENLLKKTQAEMVRIRGAKIAMIFQEPMTSLNPLFTVGNQIMETVRKHRGISRAQTRDHAIEMLRMVGIPSPDLRMNDYPYQLSGGMRQRVMIAMALSCNPKLLIADEPTTALDVTIQAQILDLLQTLQKQLGMSMLLVTHALGVVAEVANRVAVMYAGQIVEQAGTVALFSQPCHPYTHGLLTSIPRLDEDCRRLQGIEGTVPSLLRMPGGCLFHPRCHYADEQCKTQVPEMQQLEPGHFVRCWNPLSLPAREVN
jgi:oligopeptide/dipeptide ABC transporter ATP-binding protein